MSNLNVRLSAWDYKKISDDSKTLGLTISEYIRFITKNVEISVKIKEGGNYYDYVKNL